MPTVGRLIAMVLVLTALALDVRADDGAGVAPCAVVGLARDITGGVLPGVLVVLTPTGRETVTDADGRYCVAGTTAR